MLTTEEMHSVEKRAGRHSVDIGLKGSCPPVTVFRSRLGTRPRATDSLEVTLLTTQTTCLVQRRASSVFGTVTPVTTVGADQRARLFGVALLWRWLVC
ncbi:hypothetical protein PoB_002748700 [Plakobranchus ocellatus]|uniref:Uncharacterized protein n=1 Tax=Plakobranchus ocellatus TaxID=259542 RepID=A0AAV4A109_9GAST|nr:hypothetical protein PoB_002748700 [Plakobranchus ocellatus]